MGDVRVLVVDDQVAYRRALAAVVTETDGFVMIAETTTGERKGLTQMNRKARPTRKWSRQRVCHARCTLQNVAKHLGDLFERIGVGKTFRHHRAHRRR